MVRFQATQQARKVRDFLAGVNILSSAVHDRLVGQLRAEAGAGMTSAQHKLLRLVAFSDPKRIRDVACFLGVTSPAASKMVKKLIRRGLVARVASTRDRRMSGLALTDEGRRVLRRFDEAHYRMLDRLFTTHRPEGLERTTQTLDELSIDILEQENTADRVCFRCGVYFRDRCALRGLRNNTCGLRRRAPAGRHGPAARRHAGGGENAQGND